MERIIGIIVALLILSLMLFLHELGHFIAGRKLGFKVIEFSIFMGPRLWSFERKGIRYSLKAIPLGASVEFAGEYPEEGENEKPLEKGDFYERPRWARMITLLAGPFMNILTAFLVFVILFSIIGFGTTKIAEVQENSLAGIAQVQAGEKLVSLNNYKINTDFDLQIALMTLDGDENFELQTLDPTTGEEKLYSLQNRTETQYKLGIVYDPADEKVVIHDIDTNINPEASKFVLGDQVLKVNDKETSVETFSDMVTEASLLSSHYTPEAKFTVLRGSTEVELEIVLAPVEVPLGLGVFLDYNKSFLDAIPYTFSYMWSYIKGTGVIFGRIFQGKVAAQDALTGPVGIVDVFSGVVANNSFDFGAKAIQILNLFAAISLALGATNLLPIPPLDGGQLLILLIEKIRGKRLGIKAQTVVTIIGIVFVLSLTVLALGFDIHRIFNR